MRLEMHGKEPHTRTVQKLTRKRPAISAPATPRRTEMDVGESKTFIQSISAPARPASALRAAFARHREKVR
jgi:hypothetical protein